MAEQPLDHYNYHIDWFPGNEHWPNGAWSVFHINGDEIASRTVWERINPKGWYEGKVIARHSWSGYLGMFNTLEEVATVIEADRKKRHHDNEMLKVSADLKSRKLAGTKSAR